ncbi:MAG: MBL fold metallo-hydrolase [Candidatus Marinimicrobia bacterium]|nr:MBL fold metallo-hydrolase [Candidatus Neomarinimicrobiota bacterium]
MEKVVNGPFQQNAYVVWNNTHSFVIDPGGDSDRIIDIIKSNNLSPSAILNTHAHLDHIGAISTLIQFGQYPFYLHKDEIQLLNSANDYTAMFGVPDIDIPTVDNILNENVMLDFSGYGVEVIETPGHTSGGVSYLIEEHLFTGDTLFSGSIGRTDLPGGNLDTLLNSIHTKLMELDESIIVHSGHGPDTSIGVEKRTNPFLKS